MQSATKPLVHTLLLFLLPALVVFLSTPNVSLSEEGGATTTPESLLMATTTPTIPTTSATTTTTATTTDELQSSISPPDRETELSMGEVLGESVVSEEEDVGEPMSSIIDVRPPPPPLVTREFKKRVTPDVRARHSCEAETFRVDISQKNSATVRVMFQRANDALYEIEIGGLPQGVDVTFSRSSSYQQVQAANDKVLELAIHNQGNSQKGNFSIPIVYTQKGAQDSSVICQINIINQ